MKSARERAEALATAVCGSLQTQLWHAIAGFAEPSFKEHTRDQRHIVAEHVEQVAAKNAHPFVRDSASAMHHAAVNAPAPGEET